MEYNKTIYYCIVYKSNNIFDTKTMTCRRYCLTKNHTPKRYGNYQKPYAINIWQPYTITESAMVPKYRVHGIKTRTRKSPQGAGGSGIGPCKIENKARNCMLHYNTHILYKYGTILSFVTYPMYDVVPVDVDAISLQELKESICGMLKSILLLGGPRRWPVEQSLLHACMTCKLKCT